MARGPCLSRAQRGHRRRPSYSSTQTPAIFDSLKRVRFDCPEIEVGKVSETEDGDLVIETGVTWTLTPALTLPQGLEKIREAVEELKLNPPSTCTGIHRFQMAVPLSAKA
ncbi:hypothetical protein ACFX1X_011397 [Malus domestica]